MSVSENDLELLESYLDGALSFTEASPVRQRMAVESELAEAMEELRNQRAVREAVFASLLPSEDDAALSERLIGKARVTALRRQMVRRTWGLAGLAAAACLLLGLGLGHVMLQRQAGQIADKGSDKGPRIETVVSYQVALTDENGHVTAVQNFDSLEKAKAFAADVGTWQDRREQLRDNGDVLVASRL